MYKISPEALEKTRERIQTKANNAQPNPLVYIARNRTPITTQRYWEKTQIDVNVGTRSSIAVRRPHGSMLADQIFLAQVENGDAVIQYASPEFNLNRMNFSVLTTIQNVSELSLMFDGFMELHEGKVETYTTGEYPYIFYVDTSGSLMYLNLDNPEVAGAISDDAVNIASVRGLYSKAIDMDDGILVYYTNSTGQLWEAIIHEGAVDELTQITQMPTGVTGWLDIWAGTTFDYRIILQLKGDDGKVYVLPSVSRPSGYNNQEYLTISDIEVFGQIGTEPPNLISIETVGV